MPATLSVSASGSKSRLYSLLLTTALLVPEWCLSIKGRFAASWRVTACFEKNDLSLSVASVWQSAALKLCHQAEPRKQMCTLNIFSRSLILLRCFSIGLLDLCTTLRQPSAKMVWKLTKQSALICLIIDCNQQGAKLKARNRRYNKWLMAESNCWGPRQTCSRTNPYLSTCTLKTKQYLSLLLIVWTVQNNS